MTRDDDERHGDAAPGQLLLELKPIHLRHADVGHKAIGGQATWAVQKLDSRRIGLGQKPRGLHQGRQPVAHGLIIVHNVNGLPSGPFRKSASFSTPARAASPFLWACSSLLVSPGLSWPLLVSPGLSWSLLV